MVFSSVSNKEITDNELLLLYLNDNNSLALSILFERYKPLIISRIKAFGFNSLDFDDAFQECMIILFTAINHYNSQKAQFSTYVTVCINRALISFARKNNKSAEVSLCDTEDLNNLALNSSFKNNPQSIFEDNFNYTELAVLVRKSLSKLEYAVLNKLFLGLKYSEIASELSISIKSVDNAVQRIRNKFSKI